MINNRGTLKRNTNRNGNNIPLFLIYRLPTRQQRIHRGNIRLLLRPLYRPSTTINRMGFAMMFLCSRTLLRRRIRGTRRQKFYRPRLFHGTTKTSIRVNTTCLMSDRRVTRVHYNRLRANRSPFCTPKFTQYCRGLAFWAVGGDTDQRFRPTLLEYV